MPARVSRAHPQADGVEIEWARFYSREKLTRALESGEISAPGRASIAYALLADWYGTDLPRRIGRRGTQLRAGNGRMGSMNPEELLDALDPDQRAVATQVAGPLAVLAGAGTGKNAGDHVSHRLRGCRRCF